jgi:exodeoxyribonuclease-3
MSRLKASLGFLDPIRDAAPEPQKLASWWSYRAADFRASNRGLRLDHLWISPALDRAAVTPGEAGGSIHEDVRAWERPSDHAPITIDLRI